MTRVLIAGAGIAATECALALRHLAGERVDIDLLAPAPELVLRATSVSTPFGGDAVRRIALDDLARDLGVRLRRDALASVESARRHVLTRDGDSIPFDVLVVATGARSREVIAGATTFRGPMSVGSLERVVAGAAGRRLAFVAPEGARWLLPLYELALLAAHSLGERADVVVATPEHAPLEPLGPAVGEAVRDALDAAGVDLVTSAAAVAAFDGAVRLASGRLLDANVVVALPELVGPRIPGLPHDDDGFLPVDEHGRVVGCSDVFAAGDGTTFPVKHGGIAAQQADAVADAIAARVGAVGQPEPFQPVVRAQLLTGREPLYLRADLSARGVLPATGTVSTEPLWTPPEKVAGRYLARYLAGAILRDVA